MEYNPQYWVRKPTTKECLINNKYVKYDFYSKEKDPETKNYIFLGESKDIKINNIKQREMETLHYFWKNDTQALRT